MAFHIAFEPLDDLQLALLRSELEVKNIRYLVQGEFMNMMFPGPKFEHYNQPYVLIEDEDLEKAKTILEKYRSSKSKSS